MKESLQKALGLLWLITVMSIPTQFVRASEGCLAFGAGSGNKAGSVRLAPVNASCVMVLAEEKLWRERLDVDAIIYMSNDFNAFASPDGQVYLGQPLVNKMVSEKGQIFTWHAAAFILAHEYGHQFQFKVMEKKGKQLKSGAKVELQADILSGYWIGSRLKEQKEGLGGYDPFGQFTSIQRIARQAAYDVGDYAFHSPLHHGTPRQRYRAAEIGLKAGLAAKFGDPDSCFKDKSDEIFDWSEAEAAAITANK